MFSRRTDHDPSPNDLTVSLRQQRQQGATLLDLCATNPTELGLPCPSLRAFASADGARYEAHAFGSARARQLLADEYRRAGVDAAPERIVLTASTSEAYSFLFKLLADPGDRLLAPQPSYPLFDFLAQGEGVELDTYRLLFDGDAFHYEAALLERAEGARAVIAVSPNHPTGTLLDPGFWDRTRALGLPLIVDEVFGRFDLDRPSSLSFLREAPQQGLLFRLCGLSKQLGLPQAKLSWILVDGEPSLVEQALARLELIADTFLSVNGPVQHALDSLLAQGPALRDAVTARTRHNLAALRGALAGSCASVLQSAAGWNAIVRLPSTEPDELRAQQLLERHGVLAYPGSFFQLGFASLVLSLLPEPATYAAALPRLRQFLSEI